MTSLIVLDVDNVKSHIPLLCGEARKILTPDKMEKKHPDPGEDWIKNNLF
jgi:hypothetical protein